MPHQSLVFLHSAAIPCSALCQFKKWESLQNSQGCEQSTESGKQWWSHMRVASEISVSPRASLGTSSALCPSHMSLRNVQTVAHVSRKTSGKRVAKASRGRKKRGGCDDPRSEKGVDWGTLMAPLVCGSTSRGIIWHCPPPPHLSFCQGVPCLPL